MPGRATERGMTLLETLVVLGILAAVGLAMGLGVGKVRKTDLRNDAGRVASALKAAFDRASATGAHHRVTFDLTRQTFRVERCEGEVKLRKSYDELQQDDAAAISAQIAALQDQALALSQPNALPGAPLPTVGAAVASAQKRVSCMPVKGELGRPREIHQKRGIFLANVYVAHRERPVRDGEVAVNFFPIGTAERAVVEVASDADDVFSVAVHPVDGRVEVLPGRWRRPEDFVSSDDEGNAVNP